MGDVEKAPEQPQAVPMTAPSGGDLQSMLDSSDEFRIVQTRKGCLQELLGCEANSQFKFVVGENHTAMIDEHSHCCIRLFCKGARPWETTMTAGQADDMSGAPLAHFERPWRCRHAGCKCCCYQEVMISDAQKAPLGNFIETFYFCVPVFAVNKADGAHEFDIHQPTCMGGMCVNCMAQGCCNCRIPFLVYKGGESNDGEHAALKSPNSSKVPGMEEEVPDAQICKVWAGLATELFTDADTFEVKAPEGSDWQSKTRLIGATLLINQEFFESERDDNNHG